MPSILLRTLAMLLKCVGTQRTWILIHFAQTNWFSGTRDTYVNNVSQLRILNITSGPLADCESTIHLTLVNLHSGANDIYILALTLWLPGNHYFTLRCLTAWCSVIISGVARPGPTRAQVGIGPLCS